MFFGCTAPTLPAPGSAPPVAEVQPVPPTLGVYFFDFDKVDHYFAPLNDDEVSSLWPEDEEAVPDNVRLTLDIVEGDEPQKIPERISVFIDKLKDIGYTKEIVDTTHIAALKDIFREKSEDPSAMFTTCIPVYRDILLFKRDGKVVGIAKICFDCVRSHIVGTEANTWNFGQHGDYGRLAKILHPQAKAL